MVNVTSFASAFPPDVKQQELWDGFFARHYNDNPIARRFFANSGIDTRHAVANPIFDDLSTATTAQRMDRYVTDALPLATGAARQALDSAHLHASDIGCFIVASCTGYATPGIDTLVARDLGMAVDVERLVIGHMGCYAAIPALNAANNFAVAQHEPALVVCVELASLHTQPPTDDIEQMVAHSLFSDAASAAVIQAHKISGGLDIVDTIAMTDHDASELMTWTVTDHGFRMRLSQRVPDVLAGHLRPTIEALLVRNDLKTSDVAHWAIHPGGPRILDVTREQLGLGASSLERSRNVLRNHGNCSSATLFIALESLREDIDAGDNAIALAFGPGLTLYAILLRAS